MWMIAENFNGKSHNSNVISLYVSGKVTLIYIASEIKTIPVYYIFIILQICIQCVGQQLLSFYVFFSLWRQCLSIYKDSLNFIYLQRLRNKSYNLY